MAARDRYTFTLTCPTCGKTGITHVSEDDGMYTFLRNPDFRVDALPPGFRYTQQGAIASGVTFFCVPCNVPVSKS